MKLKPKHWKITNHYARFVDSNWFPNFKVTREVVEAFIKYESCGISSLNYSERALISPLIGEANEFGEIGHQLTGKPSYELLKKQIHEEIFDWWCKGWGWSPPISATIDYEFKNRHSIKNNICLKELIGIKRKLRGYPKGWQGESFKDNSNHLNLNCNRPALSNDPVINYLETLKGSIFTSGEIYNILEKKIVDNERIPSKGKMNR